MKEGELGYLPEGDPHRPADVPEQLTLEGARVALEQFVGTFWEAGAVTDEAWDLSVGQPAKDVATLALAATGGALLAKMVKGGGPVLLLSPHIVETLLAVADDIGPAVDRLAQTTGLDRAPELEETFEELRRML